MTKDGVEKGLTSMASPLAAVGDYGGVTITLEATACGNVRREEQDLVRL